MKRYIALMLIAVIAISTFAMPLVAMAQSEDKVTKSDLLEEMAKSPIYKYIKKKVENAARSIEVTDEQAALLMPIVKRGVALVPEDNGPGVFDKDKGLLYSRETVKEVELCIADACKVMGFTYTFHSAPDPKHLGDITFFVYDQNGHIVFEYDGDTVAETGIDGITTPSVGVLIGSIALIGLGIASFIVLKKYSRKECAA